MWKMKIERGDKYETKIAKSRVARERKNQAWQPALQMDRGAVKQLLYF